MNKRRDSEHIAPPCPGGEPIRAGGLSNWLIRHAARSAPASLSERLEEEWLADLAARSSAISRLRFALGCAWATMVIAQDHSIATMPVGASAIVARSLPGEARHGRGLLSRRSTAFGVVALLHLAVFYAFMTGLSGSLIKMSAPPLENRTLDETHARDLPPLPPPNLNPMKVDPPTFEPNVTFPADHAQDVIQADVPQTAGPAQNVSPPVVPPPHVARLLEGGPGVGFPLPDDYYPSLSRHMEEQGVATVRVCVDPYGRLTNDPTVEESSGMARLDEGALKLARAGSGHYRATTEDGRAVNSCYPFRIRFQLKN